MNDVVVEQGKEISEFKEFEVKMREFRERYDGVVYDLSIPEQQKQARSDRYAIGKVISSLDARHKEIKAPLAEKVALIDGARKRIKDQLLDVQQKIKSQIEEREALLTAKVQEIADLGRFDGLSEPTARELSERLKKARAVDIDSGYDEKKADAALTLAAITKKLSDMLEARKQRDAEQAELDKLRKEKEEREREEREAQIRKEAKEKAEQEAQAKIKAAERATREAEEKAEREAKQAEERAKAQAEQAAKAERDRIEREQREAAAKAESERKAEEAKKAKANHRKKIHKEATTSLIDNGITDAEKVVALVAEGRIANMIIEY